MKSDKIQWLCDEMVNLELAATHLRFSLDRSRELIDQPAWSLEDLERPLRAMESEAKARSPG